VALFKRDKKDKQAAAEVLSEVQRSRELAQKLSAKAGRDLGMDVEAVMREGAAASAGGGQDQMIAYAQRMARLSQSGLETPASIRSVELGQPSPLRGGVPAQLLITVEPQGAAPYDVTVDQVLHESLAGALAADQRITIKVDPGDPQSVMVWGVEQAPGAQPAADTDPDERLARLERLRANGVLSDEEFETQKARLLG
jgi:hypothetical protein